MFRRCRSAFTPLQVEVSLLQVGVSLLQVGIYTSAGGRFHAAGRQFRAAVESCRAGGYPQITQKAASGLWSLDFDHRL